MYALKEYVNMFVASWGEFGCNNEKLFDLWFYVGCQNDNSPIGKKRDELINSISDLCQRGLNRSLPKSMEKFEFSTSSGNDSLKTNFHRWRKGQKMSDSYIITLIAFQCMLNLHAKELFSSKGYPQFIDGNLPNDKLIDFLCSKVNLVNSADIQKIKSDERFMLPFLLGAVLHCRYEQDCDKRNEIPTDHIKSWITNKINELNNIACDFDIQSFQKRYFETLWEEIKTIDVRDIVSSGSLASIRENVEIANLYIFPSIFRDDIEVLHPIDSTKQFSYILIANTGCGKSTFLQAVVTSSIFEQLNSLGSKAVRSNSLETYKSIKDRLGLKDSYFPVFVKTSAFNESCEAKISNVSLTDIAVGNVCENYVELIENTLFQFDKNGQIILLVDALDELDGSERKSRFGKMIDDFITKFPKTNLIITSRSISFREFYERAFYQKLERLTLGIFDEKRIRELISKWMRNEISLTIEENDIETKCRYFIENRFLYTLAKNPYMLSHALHHRAHNINATPQEIVSHVIDKLIVKRWPFDKYEQKYGITAEYMREILSFIAWEMAYSGIHMIPVNDLVPRICNAANLVESDLVLDNKSWRIVVKEMNARAGLLILEEAGFVFQSDLIEHYLASEWILSRLISKYSNIVLNEHEILCGISEFLRDISSPYWSDVIVMMFSPTHRYNLHRNDRITPALFKFLLYRTAETLSFAELRVIGSVFVDLVNNTFGRNRVTNKSSNGKLAQKQIIRFLYINRSLFNDTFAIWNRDDYSDEYRRLLENYKEETK